MSLEHLAQHVPAFVLVFFRLAGMMLFAPLFGSSRIPRRLKVLMAIILALGLTPAIVPQVQLPSSSWELAIGIGGEMAFGLAMGMVMSFVFIAGQWAGEMIGQQMGLNLSEVFDPNFGGTSSLIGDLYFWLMLVTFLVIGGHHAMLRGVRASFDALPLLSVGINQSLLDMVIGLFQASTILAIQLAAPMLVTMLVVDLALGFVGKTIPQLNVMTAGLSLRAMLGMMVLIVGLVLTNQVIRDAVLDSMYDVGSYWTMPPAQ